MHFRPIILTLTAAALFIALLAPADAQTRVRIMAANTTDGNAQAYDAAGIRVFQGLDPDIILIQEFNIGSSGTSGQGTAATNQFVEDAFGPGFFWYREPGGEQIPNGVISRWPIIASGEILATSGDYNRDHAWARIDIPGDRDLWALSVHLPTTSSQQPDQANRAVSGLQALNIPPNDYVVIGGDFNTTSRGASAANIFRNYLGVSQSNELTPVDQFGNDNTNNGRNDPYDWVLVDGDLNPLSTPVTIGNNSFPEGLVFDSRNYSPLSAVAPIQSNDVSDMQHMPVVRDFLIPDGNGGGGNPYVIAGGTVYDFGDRDPAMSYTLQGISLNPLSGPVTIQSLSLSGAYASEFDFPLLSFPLTADSPEPILVRWRPDPPLNIPREVTATFTTDGSPSQFTLTLRGTPIGEGGGGTGGDPVDVSGWVVSQTSSDLSLTIPNGTVIPPQGFLVIGRQATQPEFESVWGPLPANALYINGQDIAGGNGFPLLNGDEEVSLDDNLANRIDPPTGGFPAGGLSTDNSYQRTSTASTAFNQVDETSANPGVFNGVAAQTGKVVITEVSDSPEFTTEFIELFNDAIPPAGVSGDLFLID